MHVNKLCRPYIHTQIPKKHTRKQLMGVEMWRFVKRKCPAGFGERRKILLSAESDQRK